MEQLALDLGLPAGPADTMISPANADAYALVERWPQWPFPVQLVWGPPGSGKTHLVRAFATAAGAQTIGGRALAAADPLVLAETTLAVDDVDEADERALFHLLNAMRTSGHALLLTASAPMVPVLADLASRLRQIPEARLRAPDDALLTAVMRSAFTRRQLAPDPLVIQFLLPRMERTLHEAERLVALLDHAGLALGRGPTRHLAAEVLSQSSRRLEGVR